MELKSTLFALLVLGPMALGLAAWAAPRSLRAFIVSLTVLLTGGSAIMMTVLLSRAGAWQADAAPWTLSLPAWGPEAGHWIELALVLVVLGIGLRIRDWRIILLGALQTGLVIAGGSVGTLAAESDEPAFLADPLALILVLVVSVLGSLIVVYALGYMKRHEAHAPELAARNGRFFLFLVGFLGAMNGLVMANDLRWLGVFWEITTICSFALIGHDRKDVEARRNAARALWINSLGGAAMIAAGLILRRTGQSESLAGLVAAPAAIPVALLTLAAFTKSAQMPFQSWLLGAMVAPTPVSALLHSATMVKAGSYLALRLAPTFGPTRLGSVVAIAGAFTFALAAALAISQSNAKKVLAYSTISNLGLIIACAGIATPLSYAAALMILCFHAISKGLLFLNVGAIEQEIGSRDIEDMGGVMFRMPMTTAIALLGMVSMLAPPFGMLLSKWMATEAAVFNPLVMVMIVAGSALTVMFWAKWIGRIQQVSFHEHYTRERMPATMLSVQFAMAAFVAASGVAAFFVLHKIEPLVRQAFGSMTDAQYASLQTISNFHFGPLYVFLALAAIGAWWTIRGIGRSHIRPPYLCGENTEGETSHTFLTVGDQAATAWSRTYYLRRVFSEDRMTVWANLLAGMIILTMFGMIGAI